MILTRRATLGLVVAFNLALGLAGCTSCEPHLDHACGSPYTYDSWGYDDRGYDAWQEEPDALPEISCDGPTVSCGETCCDANWKCVYGECVQCAVDAHCVVFAECAGGRCECDQENHLCVARPCDEACAEWQHCEWTDAGMACVENVCDPGCEAGTRCVDDACVPYCDKACDPGTHCAWSEGVMVCPDDPCADPCASSQHCDKGACVDNVCTGDLTNAACAALGCVCLADGACGDCAEACEPPCEPPFACQPVNGVPTCVYVDPCGCDAGTHCAVGGVCEPNVCQPACEPGQTCLLHGGSPPVDCADNTCTPECAVWQYCDGDGVCEPYACEVELDPPALDFGTIPYGESASLGFVLRNVGAGPCTFVSAKITDCDAIWSEGWSWSCTATTIPSSFFKIEQMPAPVEDGLLPGDEAPFEVGFHAPTQPFGLDEFRSLLSIRYKDRPAASGPWTQHEIPAPCGDGSTCPPNVVGKAGASP